MILPDALSDPQSLYHASRPLVERQMRGSIIMAYVLLGSLPLAFILGALNSPLCVVPAFIAMLSPLGYYLRYCLNLARKAPLQFYEGILLPGDDESSAVITQTYTTFSRSSNGTISPTQNTNYWLRMEIKAAFQVDPTGAVMPITTASEVMAFQIFPRRKKEIANELIVHDSVVLAVTPPAKWVFTAPVVLGRLSDLTSAG